MSQPPDQPLQPEAAPAALPEDRAASAEPLVAGRYRPLRLLGTGGMGEVFLAVHEGPQGFRRVVALKRMRPTGHQDFIQHFLDEARLVAKLAHRNVIQIYELGEGSGGFFVAMEYVRGPCVERLIERLVCQKQTLPPALAVDIAAQVADGLDYAYSARDERGEPLRIVHRDVSPHNVLVSVAGDVKLIDFGVAKSAAQRHVTVDATLKGKIAYLSPEQARGEPLDGRSDLFGLGIVLYEMLAARHPFIRSEPLLTLSAIEHAEWTRLAKSHPELAPADAVLEKLLARSPEDRFPTGGAASEALAALRSAFPAPPMRLGPFVASLFGKELDELDQPHTHRMGSATEVFGTPPLPAQGATEVFGKEATPPPGATAVFGSPATPPPGATAVFGSPATPPPGTSAVFGASATPPPGSAVVAGTPSTPPPGATELFGKPATPPPVQAPAPAPATAAPVAPTQAQPAASAEGSAAPEVEALRRAKQRSTRIALAVVVALAVIGAGGIALVATQGGSKGSEGSRPTPPATAPGPASPKDPVATVTAPPAGTPATSTPAPATDPKVDTQAKEPVAERPAEPAKADQPKPGGTKPAPAKEAKPAPAKEAKPAPAKEPKPAPAKEAKPAPAKEAKPAPAKEAKLASAKEPKPAPANETKPAPAAVSEGQRSALYEVTVVHGGKARTSVVRQLPASVLLLESPAVRLQFTAAGPPTLQCEPWQIVSVEGVSIGKSPVGLQGLSAEAKAIELRRPNTPPIELRLAVRPGRN